MVMEDSPVEVIWPPAADMVVPTRCGEVTSVLAPDGGVEGDNICDRDRGSMDGLLPFCGVCVPVSVLRVPDVVAIFFAGGSCRMSVLDLKLFLSFSSVIAFL